MGSILERLSDKQLISICKYVQKIMKQHGGFDVAFDSVDHMLAFFGNTRNKKVYHLLLAPILGPDKGPSVLDLEYLYYIANNNDIDNLEEGDIDRPTINEETVYYNIRKKVIINETYQGVIKTYNPDEVNDDYMYQLEQWGMEVPPYNSDWNIYHEDELDYLSDWDWDDAYYET